MHHGFIFSIVVLFLTNFAFGQGAITFYPSEGSNGVEIKATVNAQRVEDRHGVANKAFMVSGDAAISYDEFELNGSSMSFSLWLKVDENQPEYYPYPQVFRFGERDGWPSIILSINKASNILGTGNDVRFGIAGYGVEASSPLQFGSWYHAAIVIENTQLHFYLNGSLVGSRDVTIPITGKSSFWTGGSTPFAKGGFKGTLDEIKVFDYAIDRKVVEALFNEVKAPDAMVDFEAPDAMVDFEATGNDYLDRLLKETRAKWVNQLGEAVGEIDKKFIEALESTKRNLVKENKIAEAEVYDNAIKGGEKSAEEPAGLTRLRRARADLVNKTIKPINRKYWEKLKEIREAFQDGGSLEGVKVVDEEIQRLIENYSKGSQ